MWFLQTERIRTGITQVVIGIQVCSLHKGSLDRSCPLFHPGLMMGNTGFLHCVSNLIWPLLCRTKLPNTEFSRYFDWYWKGEKEEIKSREKEEKQGSGRRVFIGQPFYLLQMQKLLIKWVLFWHVFLQAGWLYVLTQTLFYWHNSTSLRASRGGMAEEKASKQQRTKEGEVKEGGKGEWKASECDESV